MFAKLDAGRIERSVGGTLQSNGAQYAVILGQRYRAHGVLAMLARQRFMGSGDMLLPLRLRKGYNRLLVDRLLHGRLNGADEVGPPAENGAVGEGGEPDVPAL